MPSACDGAALPEVGRIVLVGDGRGIVARIHQQKAAGTQNHEFPVACLTRQIQPLIPAHMTEKKEVPAQDATPSNHAIIYSERAIELMRRLRVLPTPRNYAVFYACAAGQQTDLVAEVDRIVSNKEYLSEEVLDHIFNSYIAEAQSRVVLETASTTRRIITEMMRDIAVFNGTTNTVGQEIGAHLERLKPQEMTEEDIRSLAKSVLDGAQTMQQSTESVNEQLALAQREIYDLRENLAKVTVESERDFLTGSFNRKAFDKRLLDTMEEAKTKHLDMTLIMIDIDNFREFNEKFGHLTGDEVLKFVAKIITETVKGQDSVARFGGEEFSVILPRTPVGAGMIVAEAIRKSIAGKELKRKSTGEHYGQVTVSLGVAGFRTSSDTPYQLIKRADEALYRAKRAGRNRVVQENLSE